MSRKDRKRRKQRRRSSRTKLEKRRQDSSLPNLKSLDQLIETLGQVAGQPGMPDAKTLEDIIRQTKHQLQIPEPARWPGGCDPSLARPDAVKLNLATWATATPPGSAKCQQLEAGLRQGLLSELPEIDHWAWEEFFWHGLPGDTWHPVDAYLEQAGTRYPPAAQEQLRLWKQARIGLFEITEVADDSLGLHEWDAVAGRRVGTPFRAITLNIGGVNAFREERGKVLLTHIAPWAPAQNLFCGMGYSQTVEKQRVAVVLDYLALQHLKVVSHALPWRVNRTVADMYWRRWQQREWYGWLQERVRCPFLALVGVPPRGEPQLLQVESLLPSTPEQARHFGIYFATRRLDGANLAAGATFVIPVDVTSPHRLALAEYTEYRLRAGVPPGMRGQPAFLEFP